MQIKLVWLICISPSDENLLFHVLGVGENQPFKVSLSRFNNVASSMKSAEISVKSVAQMTSKQRHCKGAMFKLSPIIHNNYISKEQL